MAGLFNRLKIWKSLEIVKTADLNAEFDNIINNLGPAGISGWSSTVAQMQIQTSPGTFGSESLPSSLNGEIERIRYQLNAIIGGPDNVWYDQPALSISQITGLLSTTPPANRIISGAVVSTSKQPAHLLPSGSAASVTLECSVTPLVVEINGTQYTFSTNITLGSLSLAPSSGNTFAINDANCDLSAKTASFGDYIADNANALVDLSVRPLADYPIIGNTVGSNISNAGGTYQAYSYTHSSVTEYFTGYVNPGALSTAVTISKAKRGFFFNSSGSPIPAIPLNNGETVTLCNLIWIYLTTSGTLLAVYTHPRYSSVQPTTSAAGDMWYDLVNQQWKQSNGSTYSQANAVLVGTCVTNGSACIAARGFDWYRTYTNTSNVAVEYFSTTEYRTKYDNNIINVYGSTFSFDKDSIRWTSTNLETGLSSLTVSTVYYLYLSETGTPYVSKYFPLRRYDLGGFYHPYNSWRCCALFLYNGSSQFDKNIISRFSDLNGEFLNDKSISVAKKKSRNAVLFDLNVTSPLVAGIDQISVSTVSDLINGTSVSPLFVQDSNGLDLTASLISSGGPVYLSLVGSASVGGTISCSGGSSNHSSAFELFFLQDGVVVYSEQSGFSISSGTSSCLFPITSYAVTLYNVPAGLHAYTMKWVTPNSDSVLNLLAFRLSAVEL